MKSQFNTLQADPEKYCKIKAASIDDEVDSQTFNRGDLCLYKTIDGKANEICYAIGNNLEKLSPNFSINQRNTVVTEDNITVRWLLRYITLTLNEDTFKFYQKLFSFGKLSVSINVENKIALRLFKMRAQYALHFFICQYTFPVVKASQGSKVLLNVSAIKATQVEREEWLFVAVDGTTPRLIFPASSVESPSIKNYFEVTFTLKAKEGIPITLEFHKTIIADVFYTFIRPRDEEEESEDSSPSDAS